MTLGRFRRLAAAVCMTLLAIPVLLSPPPASARGTKVDVCHIPPGNPDNFHTIAVNEKALSAHLAHGDLEGSCGDVCAILCDDGNLCTIDDCDPTSGCMTSPACDDGEICLPGSGQCSDACATVLCQPWQVCDVYEPTEEPFCRDTCDGFPCPFGTECALVEVACPRNPCPPIARCIE